MLQLSQISNRDEKINILSKHEIRLINIKSNETTQSLILTDIEALNHIVEIF